MGDSLVSMDTEHIHTNGADEQQPVKVTAEQLGVSQGCEPTNLATTRPCCE